MLCDLFSALAAMKACDWSLMLNPMIIFSIWRELPISSLPVSEKSVTVTCKIKYEIKKDKIVK
ncbi:flagellin FlaA [Yersinia kristensenii ATCC 33638]|nr:flagellin FlaA [Yersinia kristensenii ATCC 33638]